MNVHRRIMSWSPSSYWNELCLAVYSSMKRYDLFLVDADDTLFDFSRTERDAINGVFDTLPCDVPPAELKERYHRINKQLWKEVELGTMTTRVLRSERFQRLFDELSLPFSGTEYGEQYIDLLKQGAWLLDGAEEFCRRASAVAPVVIVTNGIADVQRARIDRSPIREFLSGIIISEEVGAGKPDPRMFDAAFRCVHRTDRSGAVMIGDSLTSDILGGFQYGIDTCWVNPAGLPNTLDRQPTMTVSSVADFLSRKEIHRRDR